MTYESLLHAVYDFFQDYVCMYVCMYLPTSGDCSFWNYMKLKV